MKIGQGNHGSALLLTIFAIALLSALVMGMLQINTEEIQLMQNQIWAAEALAIAEAGLNDAYAQIRADKGWVDGFDSKSFNGGSYSVSVTGPVPNPTVKSAGTSSQGFVARIEAELTVHNSGPPYVIRIW